MVYEQGPYKSEKQKQKEIEIINNFMKNYQNEEKE